MSNSNQNEDRDDQNPLIGADAEKLLSPQGREYLQKDRRVRANAPCPRKVLKENALLRCAAAYRAGVSIPQSVRIELWECSLDDQDIDNWDRLRLLKRRGVAFTPEQKQDYERILRLVERCLSGGCDGGEPPGNEDGPDDSGPSITDALGVQPVEDDADEARPTPSLSVQKPVPVQALPALKPEDKKKTKPRTRVPGKRSGVDFP